MSLYLIEKRCHAVVDGKVVHYRPTCRVPLEIDDAVAATLGDAVRRYAVTEPEATEVPPEAVLTTTPEEAEEDKPRGRRPRPGGDDG